MRAECGRRLAGHGDGTVKPRVRNGVARGEGDTRVRRWLATTYIGWRCHAGEQTGRGTGVALAADLALPPSIQADVVDWDRWRFRRNHPALSFAGASLVTKLALGIAVVTGPLLVSASGWTETGPISNSVALRLAMIYAWIPCVLKMVAIAIVWNFPLDERRHDMVRSRLQRYSGDYLCADN